MDDALLQPLMALVVKRGVGLGGLPQAQQTDVFALAWAGLPDGGMTERQVNEQLKGQLSAALSFVDTDHVELRRWLVDAGWLRRDGYGHEYRRVPCAESPEAGRALAAALSALAVAPWVAEHRAAHEARREARRQAWAGQQSVQKQARRP